MGPRVGRTSDHPVLLRPVARLDPVHDSQSRRRSRRSGARPAQRIESLRRDAASAAAPASTGTAMKQAIFGQDFVAEAFEIRAPGRVHHIWDSAHRSGAHVLARAIAARSNTHGKVERRGWCCRSTLRTRATRRPATSAKGSRVAAACARAGVRRRFRVGARVSSDCRCHVVAACPQSTRTLMLGTRCERQRRRSLAFAVRESSQLAATPTKSKPLFAARSRPRQPDRFGRRRHFFTFWAFFHSS